jgi:AmmeMemoRadiSam system protein B
VSGLVRASAVAGSWYSASPRELTKDLTGFLADVPEEGAPGRLVALVSPHAGFRYSGAVAAHAYAQLAGRTGLTVVLAGPSHRFDFPGIALWPRGRFETPLGPLDVDDAFCAALLAASDALLDAPGPHAEEHSLEMQLPFVKHVCPDARIVPALMGRQGPREIEALADALAAVVPGSARDVVLVASSDLSHYHPASVANRMDRLVAEDVERFDPVALGARLAENPEHACGGGPVVAVMKAARALGADTARVLRYADSGDAGERNKARVVGYLAAAFFAA